jgi:hypothetical protein
MEIEKTFKELRNNLSNLIIEFENAEKQYKFALSNKEILFEKLKSAHYELEMFLQNNISTKEKEENKDV